MRPCLTRNVLAEFLTNQALTLMARSSVFASRITPLKRIRRRGFRRDVRRGDDLTLPDGELVRVARRSRRHLWVEPNPRYLYFDERGKAIGVRLPARYR